LKKTQAIQLTRIIPTILTLLIALSATSTAATEATVYTFSNAGTGFNSYGGLIFDSAGNLYGTTREGGAFGSGTVFELSPGPGGVWTETVLYSFKGGSKDGAHPVAPLVFDKVGNLYGTTYVGGTSYRGTAFELSPDGKGGWTESVIYNFYGKKGTYPEAGLVIDLAGNLYGTTLYGGDGACRSNPNGPSCGTVFRLKKGITGKWIETVIHTFTGAPDGAAPAGGVVLDGAGNLYGATTYGGGSSAGTVFRLAPAGKTWTYSVIYSFAGGPNGTGGGPLILDNAGNLYGPGGGGDQRYDGIVFRLTPNNGTWTESVLHTFGAPGDGSHPIAVTLDSAGNLYGATLSAGVSSNGIVYKLTPNPNGPWTETILYTFPFVNDGPYPDAPLTLNAAQTSLFSTALGYAPGKDIVYEITP
jgi:uncharacterized repeat protein (TIGR03803 family)